MPSQRSSGGKPSGSKQSSQAQTKQGSQKSSKSGQAAKRKKGPVTARSKKKVKPNRIESDEDDEDDAADRPPEDGEDEDKSEEEYDDDATLNDWLKDERKTKPLGPYRAYHEAAKWIVKAFYPFTRYHLLWTVYRWTKKRAFFDYETERKIPEDEFRRKYRVVHLIDVLSGLIVDFSEDLGALQRSSFPKLAQAMGTSASRGRGDDISGLKSRGISYAVKAHQGWYAANPWATRMDPVGRKEVVRGPRDPLALYLLLPPPVTEGARNDWENGWKEFSNQVIGGKTKITGIELPRVLYHNLNYDPDDLQQGLLLSELLIMVWKHLFLAPASAVERDPKPAPSTGTASRHGMTSVTPNSIAYAALLLFWTLSDLTNWKRPEHFAAEAYWEVIVSVFIGDVHGDGEDVDEEWTKTTLDAWNAACFGDVDEEADYEEPIVPSTWELVRKQRRVAREARAKEAQASASQTQSSASSRSSSPGPTSTGASSSTLTDGDDDAEQLANHC